MKRCHTEVEDTAQSENGGYDADVEDADTEELLSDTDDGPLDPDVFIDADHYGPHVSTRSLRYSISNLSAATYGLLTEQPARATTPSTSIIHTTLSSACQTPNAPHSRP